MLNLLGNEDLRFSIASKARREITSNYERKEFWKILLKEYQELESGL